VDLRGGSARWICAVDLRGGSARWICAVDLRGGSERAPAAASAWTAGALPGRHGPYPRSQNGAAALLVPARSLDTRAKPPGREPPPYERVRYERIRHVVRSPAAPGPMTARPRGGTKRASAMFRCSEVERRAAALRRTLWREADASALRRR